MFAALSPRLKWFLLLLLLLTPVFLAAAVLVARPQGYMVNGDFFEEWLGGKLVWSGDGLFDPARWGPPHAQFGNSIDSNPVFPYPYPIALFMAPLGLLPLPAASVTWFTLSAWMVVVSVALVMAAWERQDYRHYLLPVLAGVFLFRPVMVTLRNGQLGVLFLLFLALACYFWGKGRWVLGGIFLPLILLRPNIGLPIFGLVDLWLLYHKKWPALLSEALSIATLGVGSWLAAPGWLEAWLANGSDKLLHTFSYQPSLWGLAGTLCGHQPGCVLGGGAAVALGLAALYLLAVIKLNSPKSFAALFSAAIALGLFLAPYMWAYDQILLVIMGVNVTGRLLARGAPYFFTATFQLFLSILALVGLQIAISVGIDVWSGLLSLLGFVIPLILEGKRSN